MPCKTLCGHEALIVRERCKMMIWKAPVAAPYLAASFACLFAAAEPIKTPPYIGLLDRAKGTITWSGHQYRLLDKRELRAILRNPVTLDPASGVSEWQVFSPDGVWRVLHRGRVEFRGSGRWSIKGAQICVTEVKTSVCSFLFRGERNQIYRAVASRNESQAVVYKYVIAM